MAKAYLGDNEVEACYLGDNEVDFAYLSDTAVCDLIVFYTFHMKVWKSTIPGLRNITGGTVTITDNADGTWEITSPDPITGIQFDTTNASVTEVEVINSTHLTTAAQMFSGLTDLTRIDFSGLDTSNVTDMTYMMRGWSVMTVAPDISGFNTSNVTNMRDMMANWLGTTTPPDLTGLDTSSVTNMDQLLLAHGVATTPPNLTGLDTTSVTTMSGMMSGWLVLDTPPDFSSFNTTNVIDMSNMFLNWHKMPIQPSFSSFNTLNVTDMSAMFRSWDIIESLDITAFDTSSVLNFDIMFRDNALLKCITNINTTAGGASKTSMFDSCTVLAQPDAATQIDITDGDGLDWTNGSACPPPKFSMTVTSPTSPPFSPRGGTLHIDDNLDGTWHVWSNDTSGVFADALKPDRDKVTSAVVHSTEDITNGSLMFRNLLACTHIDLSACDLSFLTTADQMFGVCTNLDTLVLPSGPCFQNTTNFENLFNNSDLKNIDLTSMDTSSATSFKGFFASASAIGITNVPVPFSTASVTDMSFMYSQTYNIESIDFSTFSFTNCANFDNMFGDSLDIICFTNINTTLVGSSKANMFANIGVTMLQPGPGDRNNIDSAFGDDWTNANPCP